VAIAFIAREELEVVTALTVKLETFPLSLFFFL